MKQRPKIGGGKIQPPSATPPPPSKPVPPPKPEESMDENGDMSELLKRAQDAELRSEELENRLEDLEKEKRRAEEDAALAQRKAQDLEDELKGLRENADPSKELAVKAARIEELERLLRSAKDEIKSDGDSLEKARQKIATLGTEKSVLEGEKKALKEEKEDLLKVHAETLLDKQTEFERALAAVKLEVTKVTGERDAAVTEKGAAVAKAKASEAARTEFERLYQEAQKVAGDAPKRIADLEQKLKDAETARATLEQERDTATNQAAAAEAARLALEGERDAARREAAAETQRADTLAKAMAANAKQLADAAIAVAENTTLRTNLAAYQANEEALRAQLQRATTPATAPQTTVVRGVPVWLASVIAIAALLLGGLMGIFA